MEGVAEDEVKRRPGKLRRPWERVRPGPREHGCMRWGGTRLTCFVGSAEFPDVLIVSGGEDLDQTGLIGASPLRQQRTQTTGLSQLPRQHPGNEP